MKKSFKDNVSLTSEHWMSFTDMMTGLLFIFLLILVGLTIVLMLETAKLEGIIKSLNGVNPEEFRLQVTEYIQKRDQFKKFEEASEADKFIDELMKQLAGNLNKKNIKVSLNSQNKTIHIDTKVLSFEKRESAIAEDSEHRLRVIAQELYTLLNKDKSKTQKFIDGIFIEGHTDSDRFVSPGRDCRIDGDCNWELSSERAIAVWSIFKNFDGEYGNGEKLDSFINSRGEKLFSVSGYAYSRPNECSLESHLSIEEKKKVCSRIPANSAESKTMNRRIDIRFTPYHESVTGK